MNTPNLLNPAPLSAYQFRASAVPQFAPQEDAGSSQPRTFSGVAYSGQPLRHPYWGVVVFDVASTRAANPTTPILVDHDPSHRAGFAALRFENHQITIAEGTLLDNEHGRQIATESDQGFPWQMSVFIDPSRVEEVAAGVAVSVNGQALVGPVTVFREALIREVSFTAIGVDYRTEATALALDPAASFSTSIPPLENPTMTLEELQAQNAQLQASLDAATQRATVAEQQLTEQRQAIRLSAIHQLFSELGREVSDTAMAPYLAMEEATFSAVSADLKAVKPAAPAHLFSQQAVSGQAPDAATTPQLTATAIYNQRSQKHG